MGHTILTVCVLINFSEVAEYLQLKDTDLDISSAVILDYYVGALSWCKDQSYTSEQTSAFFTVNDTLFRNLGINFIFCVFSFICFYCHLAHFPMFTHWLLIPRHLRRGVLLLCLVPACTLDCACHTR